jgi:hypothetical protein
MGYNEDLLPLADQINIVFKLELSPILTTLVNKYGTTTLSGKHSKKEFSKELKKALKKILTNLSKNYTNKLLDNYFSQEGLGLFISNILIDESTKFIVDIRN